MKSQTDGLLSPLIKKIRLDKIPPFFVGGKILDIGCGDGSLCQELKSFTRYIGIDINANQIKKAKKTYPGNSFCARDIENCDFAKLDGPFDNIILAAVIEHLDNPWELLVKLRPRLSKDGRIIITTPTRIGLALHRFLADVGLASGEARDQHKRAYEYNDFLKISRLLGLELYYQKFFFNCNQLVILKNS